MNTPFGNWEFVAQLALFFMAKEELFCELFEYFQSNYELLSQISNKVPNKSNLVPNNQSISHQSPIIHFEIYVPNVLANQSNPCSECCAE